MLLFYEHFRSHYEERNAPGHRVRASRPAPRSPQILHDQIQKDGSRLHHKPENSFFPPRAQEQDSRDVPEVLSIHI